MAFWDVITGGPTLSFQWIVPSALVVSIVMGVSLSLVPVDKTTPANRLLLGILAGLPVAACNLWICGRLIGLCTF